MTKKSTQDKYIMNVNKENQVNKSHFKIKKKSSRQSTCPQTRDSELELMEKELEQKQVIIAE